MGRLTKRDVNGDAKILCENCPEYKSCNEGNGCVYVLSERLAAYEDTGLTPERCAELAAADGVPVIHAHWTNKKEKWHDGETYCSACGAEAGAEYGRYTYLETEYCPNCGARMDEQEECKEQEAQHDN